MTPREELDALRRMAELEAKAGNSGPPNGGLSEADRATLLAAKPLDRGGRNDYGALGAARDVVAGGVRGAGSIGATMIGPIDWAMDKMEGRGGHTLSSLITGVKPLTRNEQRRADMDAGLSSLLGADPESISYKVGKIGAEVAGTAGVGGALASGVQAIPTIARYAPNVATALRTGGIGRQSGNMLTRVGAGAVTGGASAGLVDPDNALFGAGIGAVLPVAGAALGRAAGVVRGPEQPKELASAVTKARESGYVIPPTQAKGSIVNRLMEGLSGKISTAQNASALNQKVTDRLAKSAIGAADDAPLTPEVLDNIREEAGKAYGAISRLGKLEAAGSDLPKSVGVKKFTDPLTLGQRIEVDAGEVIRAWKQANHDATAYFRAYARDANPETLAKAKSAASDAGKIDKFLEDSLSKLGMDDMVSALKDARVRIAKTYSVENALDATTGTIDARKLAAAMQKGKPLSGELKSIAEFAGRFPKAAQRPEAMGSLPQLSPLDWAAGGAMSAASANPLYLAATFARPGARKAALSPIVQNRLIQGPQNQLVRSAFTGSGRAAPVTAAEIRSSLEDDR